MGNDDTRDMDLDDERAEQQFRDHQHRRQMSLPFGHLDEEESSDE